MPEANTPKPVPSQDDLPLEEIERRVRVACRGIQTDLCNALHKAMACGDLLIGAQAQVHAVNPRGWERWLRNGCLLSRRTAHLYMQLSRNREEIENRIAEVGDLTLRGAVRLIQKSTEKTDDKETDDEKTPPGEAKTSTLLTAWTEASLEERRRFLNDVRREELVGLIPAGWDLQDHLQNRMLRVVPTEKLMGELRRRVPDPVWKKHQTSIKALSRHPAGPTLELELEATAIDTSIAESETRH